MGEAAAAQATTPWQATMWTCTLCGHCNLVGEQCDERQHEPPERDPYGREDICFTFGIYVGRAPTREEFAAGGKNAVDPVR